MKTYLHLLAVAILMVALSVVAPNASLADTAPGPNGITLIYDHSVEYFEPLQSRITAWSGCSGPYGCLMTMSVYAYQYDKCYDTSSWMMYGSSSNSGYSSWVQTSNQGTYQNCAQTQHHSYLFQSSHGFYYDGRWHSYVKYTH